MSFFLPPMKNIFFLCCSLCLVASFSLEGQEAGDSVLISILRPVDVFGARHLTEDRKGQSLIRLERKEIQSLPVQSINELLEYSMSLDVRQRGPMDVQSDLSLRGSTFDQVLVMLNGHPLNDPQTGHHNMNLPVNLDQIEAVEILYGGASVRYGPYAFAGAINLITKQSIGGKPLEAEMQGGAFGYRMLRLGSSVSSERHGLAVNMQYSGADGYIANTDFEQYSVHLQSDHFTSKWGSHHLRLEAGYNSKDYGAQSFYSSRYPLQFEATRTAFAGVQLKSPIGWNIHYAARLFARRHWDRFELFRETGGPYTYANGRFINGNDTVPAWYAGHNYHRTDVWGGDALAAMNNCLGRTEAGLDFRFEGILSNALGEPMDDSQAVWGSERGEYTRSSDRRNLGLFGRHTFEWDQFGALQLALRYNHNTAFGDDWMPAINYHQSWSREKGTWKAHLGWNRAFRLPTYTDLYYNLGGAVGSINLQPEYSLNYEMGVHFQRADSKAEWSVSLFRREGQNLIDWIIDPNDSTQTLQAANITTLNLNGIEGQYRWRNNNRENTVWSWLQYGLEATYMVADERPNDFESLYALDYLRWKMGLFGQWKLPASLFLTARYSWQDRVGEYTDASNGQLREFADVHLLDLRLEWKKAQHWRLFVDVNNLLDQSYVDRANVIQPGIWTRLGVQYSL